MRVLEDARLPRQTWTDCGVRKREREKERERERERESGEKEREKERERGREREWRERKRERERESGEKERENEKERETEWERERRESEIWGTCLVEENSKDDRKKKLCQSVTFFCSISKFSIYCTAGNFRQRKISSKATARQFVRNLFSSNMLFGRSVVALLLLIHLHIHEYFWSHTCGWEKN